MPATMSSSMLLLGLLCALHVSIVKSTRSAAEATNSVMITVASLTSANAPNVAWQNSMWNLAGHGVPAGSSASKFLNPEGDVSVVDQEFVVTFKRSATDMTAREADGLFAASGASAIQASGFGLNAWNGFVIMAPDYIANWAFLLQQLADMPDVVAIEPHFVVSNAFSTAAIALKQQQIQTFAGLKTAGISASTADLAAEADTQERTAVAIQNAESRAAAVPQHLLVPTFAYRPDPAATAMADEKPTSGQSGSSAITQQVLPSGVGTPTVAASAAATAAADAGSVTEQAAAETAAADWLPRQAGAGRKLKAW